MQNTLDYRESSHSQPINIDDLADIQDVIIDTDLPREERLKSYLQQIKNPYCYRLGDMVVRVSFAEIGVTLEDRIKQYLLSGQGVDLTA